MRPLRWIPLALPLFALVAAPPAARAQIPSEGRVAIAVAPYGGVFVFDDSELQDDAGLEVDVGPILGARLTAAIGEDWRVEGAYGYASATVEESEFVDFPTGRVEEDLAVHLAYGAVGYVIANDEVPTRLLLSAGAGVFVVDPETGDAGADFMVSLGAGFTHPANEWITVRGEVRDHVSFCSGSERHAVLGGGDFAPCFGDEALHHWEISGGLEFWVF